MSAPKVEADAGDTIVSHLARLGDRSIVIHFRAREIDVVGPARVRVLVSCVGVEELPERLS